MRQAQSNLGTIVLLAAIAAALILTVVTPSQAVAGTQLWLYPESDDPRNGGHVLDTGVFTLNIENRGSGNGDNTAYAVTLVFSVNDPALFAGGTIGLPDGSTVMLDPAGLGYGTPVLPCSARTFPPHSVYPAYITEILVGDLLEDEVVQLAIDVAGSDGLRAHFDAHAIGYKETGQGTRCQDVTNPSGHDVSIVLGEGADDDCPELEIDKVADPTGVDLLGQVVYVITVENTGTCDIEDLVVVENIPTVTADDGSELPAFTVVVADPPPTTSSDTELVWELGVLPVDGLVTLTLTVVFDQPLTDGTKVVNTACAIAAGLDHRQCARAKVAVGDVADDNIGSPGFWCNQIRFALEGRHNAKFTVEELDGWLVEINDLSVVFPDLWDTTTLELARDLLCHPNHAGNAADRLARHLLTLWFNIVSGRVDPAITLGELCPGSVLPPVGADLAMTVAEVVANAEAVALDGTDRAALVFWAHVIDFVNNARLPNDDGGCGQVGARRGRRRH